MRARVILETWGSISTECMIVRLQAEKESPIRKASFT
jgi:hypothetical protein